MKLKYTIVGLDCPNCAAKLASMIESEEGIDSAKINFLTEKLTVETSLDESAAFDLILKQAKAFDEDISVEK
jgi:copper chaperone CopZ